jgi:hypothetical protein
MVHSVRRTSYILFQHNNLGINCHKIPAALTLASFQNSIRSEAPRPKGAGVLPFGSAAQPGKENICFKYGKYEFNPLKQRRRIFLHLFQKAFFSTKYPPILSRSLPNPRWRITFKIKFTSSILQPFRRNQHAG